MMPPAPVFLGLGSNLGDRERNLGRARALLGERGFESVSESAIYETEPVGGPPQGAFLNQVIFGFTALLPEALLCACLEVEQQLGRVRRERNGPRILDIDVLFYADLVRSEADPLLPHPRMHERRFVLAPLAEIAPQVLHPVLGVSVLELLARCPDQSRVVRLFAPARHAP